MSKRIITAIEYFNLRENTLGERIRFFREETGKLNTKEDYSTRALSKRLGVTAQSITAIERGDSKNPSFQLILGLANELHVPIAAFTDDFYTGDINLLEIGLPDEDERAVLKTEDTGLDPALSSNFHFGCYVYQVFKDGRMRIVYSSETKDAVDYRGFIESLSRFIAEIEIHSLNKEILDTNEIRISPLQNAIELFKACLEYPNAFPFILKEAWNRNLNEFVDMQKQHTGENKIERD